MNHVWSVLCTRSVLDQETNNISLIEVIEELTLTPDPRAQSDQSFVVPINCELVSLWTRSVVTEPERGTARTVLIGPRGERISEHETSVDLSVHLRSRIRARLAGLPISSAGIYGFLIQRLQGERVEDVATIPVRVVFGPVEGQPPGRLS
jgi:hypothetical protein